MTAISALFVAAALLAGAAAPLLGPARALFENWLVVLFRIDAVLPDATMRWLHKVVAVDVGVLFLSGLAFVGWWRRGGWARSAWTILAIGLPFAGIAVLAVTRLAGRSGLMGGGVVLSCLMLREPGSRRLGALGLVANTLLLLGDFGTLGARAPSVALVVAIGYVGLVVWFGWMGLRMLFAGRSHSRRTREDVR